MKKILIGCLAALIGFVTLNGAAQAQSLQQQLAGKRVCYHGGSEVATAVYGRNGTYSYTARKVWRGRWSADSSNVNVVFPGGARRSDAVVVSGSNVTLVTSGGLRFNGHFC